MNACLRGLRRVHHLVWSLLRMSLLRCCTGTGLSWCIVPRRHHLCQHWQPSLNSEGPWIASGQWSDFHDFSFPDYGSRHCLRHNPWLEKKKRRDGEGKLEPSKIKCPALNHEKCARWLIFHGTVYALSMFGLWTWLIATILGPLLGGLRHLKPYGLGERRAIDQQTAELRDALPFAWWFHQNAYSIMIWSSRTCLSSVLDVKLHHDSATRVPLTETARQGQTYQRQLDLLKTATQSPHPLHAHEL